MILTKLPGDYLCLWYKQSCVGGSRVNTGALRLDFIWIYFINEIGGGSGSLNTCIFCSFSLCWDERKQKAQLQQGSWKLQV